MLSGIVVYSIVYQFYVKWFDRSVVQADPNRPTPAHTYMDGVEFFPSNKYVMLGWHWKSIAALGPVTGPALAIVWGWLPGFLWILTGISLAMVALAVYLSQVVFGSAINSAFVSAVPDAQLQEDILLITMLGFSFLGAVLPLWSFAMPINYLGFYVAYFVIAAIIGSS